MERRHSLFLVRSITPPRRTTTRLKAATDFACLAARPKSLLKTALGDADGLSGYKATHPPFCHSDAERRRNLVRSQLRLSSKHAVYTEFFGIADSSAAFGVGMTRTIEQCDPESFSANSEAEPFQTPGYPQEPLCK